MELLSERQLGEHVRFSAQRSEYHLIITQDGTSTHEEFKDQTYDAADDLRVPERLCGSNVNAPENDLASPMARLRCVLQRTRPDHISTQPDLLPFKNVQSFRECFSRLDLPMSYLQIADGSVATTSCRVEYDQDRCMKRMEFISYCVSKHGDWSLALSYSAHERDVSVFWSVEQGSDPQHLVDSMKLFRNMAVHPMLIPCIMYAKLLERSIRRRSSLKSKLQSMEVALQDVSKKIARVSHIKTLNQEADLDDGLDDVSVLLLQLQSCRRQQSSREGRYHFWESYHAALEKGLGHCDELKQSPEFISAHMKLRQWSTLTWERFQSLQARDKDHVNRVNLVAETLYLLIQQQESQVQTRLAKAAQMDNEDMKFIAVLGSIFLPAGLVSSLLGVDRFQFLEGPQLFGFYIGVTVPFITLVVCICRLWPRWNRRRMQHPDEAYRKYLVARQFSFL